MKSLRLTFFALFLFSSLSAFSQHVYGEKIDNCYLDQFIFESDKIIAKLDNEKITEVVTTGFDAKVKKGIEGILGFQVLVDNRGNSCLMSVRNDTNQKTKKLNLASSINDNLKWPRMAQKVSVIVVMEFEKGGEITVKRMGTVDNKNLIELSGE